MSNRVFAPKASIRQRTGTADRIRALSVTPSRSVRSPSPALVRPPPPPQQKPGPSPCKNCGSTEVEEGDGNIVCKGCGLVLSNAPNYTSDITFEEGSNGRIQQQGQRVADGQTHQKAFTARGPGGGPGHEATPAMERAKTEAWAVLRRFCMLLHIEEPEQMSARRIFELAYLMGFVRGRTVESVAIVCLYVAVRRAVWKAATYPVMLIDFAEHANMNVFDLGKMMQDLIRKLYLSPDGSLQSHESILLQPHGAEVLISKFVNHLDFGSDSEKIKTDATRILQRMKRDWIHHGRRPSGVCGAAVILAARMNNYRRTLREVVLVAKVTEITVSKRLEEFKETKSSDLSVNDFRNDEILGSITDMDPPAFYRALQPPKPKGKRGKRKRAAETAAELEGSESGSPPATQSEAAGEAQPAAKTQRIDADGFAIPAIPARSSQGLQDNLDPSLRQDSSSVETQPARRGPGRKKGSKNWKAPPPSPAELAMEEELTSSMQAALDENQDLDTTQLATPSATQASSASTQASSSSDKQQSAQQSEPQPPLPLRVDPAECNPKKGPPGPAVNTNIGNTGTISLEPIICETEFDSDPEVSTCLLSEPERMLKEKIWVTENADWLRQDHAKKIRRELKDRHLREQGIDPDEERKGKKGEIKKRKDGARRSGRIGDVTYLNDAFHRKGSQDHAGEGGSGEGGRRPSAASQTVKAMMKQRGTYSRRINYDNLVKAYEYPVGPSTSPSRASSIDRESREGSVVSVSSTGTASTTVHESIGPLFMDSKSQRSRKSRTAPRTTASESRGNARSPSAESYIAPEAERGNVNEDDEAAAEQRARQRDGSAASPEPMGIQESVEAAEASSASSPLSSTYTPAGVGTPGSTGPAAPVRIDRSMYGDLGKAMVTASTSKAAKDTIEDEEDYDEDDDDDEDDDEENDPDEDLEDAFAGKYREQPTWEGEDEVVED